MINIFKKFIKLIKDIRAESKLKSDINQVFNLTYNYRNIEILKNEPINITDEISIVKSKSNDLILFIKKSNWNKYIGISRDWLSDSMGGDLPSDTYYKSSDLARELTRCYMPDIPMKILNEMYIELINHKDEIKEFLNKAWLNEFYK